MGGWCGGYKCSGIYVLCILQQELDICCWARLLERVSLKGGFILLAVSLVGLIRGFDWWI